jgi:3'-5' exonuclease
MVNADLHHLETVSGQGPFVGRLELGAFTKECFLISDAQSSLSDLTAEILGKCLPKSNTEQISTNWGDSELSPAQRDYAAKDAYASLTLYHTINKIPLPEKITRSTPIDTPVIVLSDDQKKIIAHGVLSSSEDHFLDGVHITSTHAVVHVHKVIIPGAILKLHSRSLNDLGQPPFDIVSHQSCL